MWMEGWVRVADTHIMSRASYPRNRRCSLAGAAPPILFCANITGGGDSGIRLKRDHQCGIRSC